MIKIWTFCIKIHWLDSFEKLKIRRILTVIISAFSGANIPSFNEINSNSPEPTLATCPKFPHLLLVYFLCMLSTGSWASLVAQWWRISMQFRRHGFSPWMGNLPWRRKWQPTPVILDWEIPRTEEPDRLQPIGSHRVRHDWATK